MNPKLPLIEKYIQKRYPEVFKVDFKTQKVHLASGDIPKEERDIIRYIILITFDNSNNDRRWSDLSDLLEKIWEDVDTTFSLDVSEYGSKYEFEYFVLTTIPWIEYSKKVGAIGYR